MRWPRFRLLAPLALFVVAVVVLVLTSGPQDFSFDHPTLPALATVLATTPAARAPTLSGSRR